MIFRRFTTSVVLDKIISDKNKKRKACMIEIKHKLEELKEQVQPFIVLRL